MCEEHIDDYYTLLVNTKHFKMC